MAVDCISHCVSIEAPFLTTVISPFLYSWNTAVNLPLASQSAYPVLTEEQDLSFSLSLFFFLHLIYIFITIIFISTCCLCELTSEQYAHVKKRKRKISNGTLAFYELIAICSFVLLLQNCHVNWWCFLFKHTQRNTHTHTHSQTHPCDDNPAIF